MKSIYDEANEKLESIKKETYQVYRDGYYQPDVHEVFDESDGRFWKIKIALERAKKVEELNNLLNEKLNIHIEISIQKEIGLNYEDRLQRFTELVKIIDDLEKELEELK